MFGFTFAHPQWLWELLVLPIFAIIYFLGEQRREKALTQLIAARLQPRLAANTSLLKRRLRFALVLAALTLLIITLAQPRRGTQLLEIRTQGRDILIAIDVSKSMLAGDISPSRLARAKLAAEDLIGKLHGDRVGLVAFAGSAFLQAPLTIDYAAVLTSLRELDPESIPLGGTNIAEAIHTAADAFGKGESEQRALIIMTDGEELDADGVEAARKYADAMHIFTVGLGSPNGTIIAIPDRAGHLQYLKGPDGQVVKSSLDEKHLQAIAEAAHGFYVHLESGPAEMENILRNGLDPMGTHEAETMTLSRPIERYRWPLAGGMLLLALSLLPGERRSRAATLGAFALAMVFGFTPTAQAKNEGVEAYEREDYPGALDSFQKQLEKRPNFAPLQFDRGAAAYQSGDFDKALESFSQALTTRRPSLREKAEYNLGNTLFYRGSAQQGKPEKLKDWKNAVQHFDEALKVDPKDGNAQYNRDVVLKAIAELEKEQKEEEKKKQEQQEQQKDQQEKKDQQGEQKEKQQGGQGQKDQQQKGGGKDQQEPSQGQEGKDQQQGQPKDGRGTQGQPKPAQPKDGQEQKGNQGKETKPERDLKGEIKPAQKGDQQSQEAQEREAAERQEQADAAAAASGKMTPTQAASLLDSLKNADDRVQLLQPEARVRTDRQMRDW